MKQFLIVSLLWIQAGSLNVLKAQDYMEDLQDNKAAWEVEKKHVVEQFMELNAQEAKKFWPLYDQYTSKLNRLIYERMELVQQYESDFPNLSESQAMGYTNRLFKNDGALTRLSKKILWTHVSCTHSHACQSVHAD